MPTTHHYSERPHLAFPKMPGRYGVKCGYVYALICEDRTVKIGSTVHPRFRIGEQCGLGGHIWNGDDFEKEKLVRVRRIFLSGAHRSCRELERTIHAVLQPFRLGHHRNEKYRLSAKKLAAVIQLFSLPLSMRRIQEFTDVIYPAA